jgi:hypothetical protein
MLPTATIWCRLQPGSFADVVVFDAGASLAAGLPTPDGRAVSFSAAVSTRWVVD